MPLKANDVTVEAEQGAASRPTLVIQKEDNRRLSSNSFRDHENLSFTVTGSGNNDANRNTSTVSRGTGGATSNGRDSPQSHHTHVNLNARMAGSPSESVASPPFFPTSRHHSFFMDDLDSRADEDNQSPTTSGHQVWTRTQSPTAAFAGIMAPSRTQCGSAPDGDITNTTNKRVAANTQNSNLTTFSGTDIMTIDATRPQAATTGQFDHASDLTTSSADNDAGSGGRRTTHAATRAAEKEEAVEVRNVRRRKHRHHLVATAPPFDRNRPQQWNLLTFGPDPELPLYTFKEIPHWQKYNPYICNGYRAFYTAGMSLKSILGWHNETINVHSHFLTFVAFVVLTTLLYTTVLSKAISAPSMKASKLMYAIFCLGSMLCTLNSSIYHLFNSHSHQRVMTAMGRLDFIGITVLIVASFLPPLYVMFHCYTTLRIVYISAIVILGSAAIIGPWTDTFHEHVGLRVATFLGLGFSGLVPSIHSAFLLPFTAATLSIATGFLLMVLLYCGGVIFYVTQFPESKFPGYFDFWLSSHQIWHFFVSMAALVHYFNCVSMYQLWQISDGVCN